MAASVGSKSSTASGQNLDRSDCMSVMKLALGRSDIAPVTSKNAKPMQQPVGQVQIAEFKKEGDEIGDSDDSDTDSESANASKPQQRTSERKRMQYAVFDAWKNSRLKDSLKAETKAQLEEVDDELLTIRGLMNKAESRKIVDDPRDYQLELLERAKKENTIAVLDTGTGKTLIAVMLLMHVVEQELEEQRAGKAARTAFFLVDVATLVYQQAAVLEHNWDQPIARFCGDMGVDSWSKSAWREHFKKNKAIVMTAAILLNCLSHGFIRMDEINLLIFDEAHHTKKNHAYARIIKDYYIDTPESKRPRIFGMTASPVDAKVDVIQATQELERLLHSKIATASHSKDLRKDFKPAEWVCGYEHLPRDCTTSLCSELERKFRYSRILGGFIDRSKTITSELGEWCADRYWTMLLSEEEAAKLERQTEQEFSTDAISRALILNQELEHVRQAKKLVADSARLQPPATPNMGPPALSSKVLRLKEFLEAEYENPTEARTIVFVERRATAVLLQELFKNLGTHNMQFGVLIGTRQAESGDLKVTMREQLMTLIKFRKGEINVLFATSIAEEGLDIPMCNVIIRFDLCKTLIQYIQSRGRARHKQSKYIHMIENGNSTQKFALQDVKQGEAVLKAFCQNLPVDRLLSGLDSDFDPILLKEKTYRTYTEPSTGAKLTYGTVLTVLDTFVSCLSRNDESIPRAMYILGYEGKRYQCEVLLPATSPIRSVIGRPYSKKSIAKRSAAFEACLLLRKDGHIDEHLLPKYRKDLPAMRNAHLALTDKVGNSYDMRVKPVFWQQYWGSIPAKLSMVVLRVANPGATERPLAPLLLLTREPLPSLPYFPVYMKPGVATDMNLVSLNAKLAVTEENVKALTDFTLRVFKDPFNKVFENNPAMMSYWLAPVTQGIDDMEGETLKLIDWEMIKTVQGHEWLPWSMGMPHEEIENRFIVDPYNGGHRYYTVKVDPKLHALDPPPEGVNAKKHMESILSWSSSLWKASRDRARYNIEQPVLRAYHIPARRNWLDDWEEKDISTKTEAYICLEALRISPLPVPVAAMSYVFPALIWRIDSYLMAREACEYLGLEISIDLALEALTKDSDNTDEHRMEQLHFQRGMGKNYERLEFIGDAFLKMATSISLYAQNAGDDEFESHVKRMLMICNKNLFKNALSIKLYEYIRSQGFSRRTWYPEGISLLQGKGAKKNEDIKADIIPNKFPMQKHSLNDKTIADVCEALIGASLLTHRASGSMDMAVKAVSLLVKSSDHDVEAWKDYYKLYKMPLYQIADCTAAELDLADRIYNKLGYRFKHPRLLRCAFTHPSWPYVWGQIPSYQRLEFLGDSLLDMVCVNYLFHKYTDKDPQWLTEHKMAMVSNKFLAALSVHLKFNNHLKTHHMALKYQIQDYVKEIDELAEKAFKEGRRDYWTETEKTPPKCLPDIVESYIGAIFVDSCFDFAVVENFFEKHIRWFFEDMTIYDTFANNHPTTFLANLLTNTFNCTHYRLLSDELPNELEGTAPRIVSVVMIHFQVIADAESSSSKYAKIRASSKALDKLKGLAPWEFRKKYGCDCKEAESHDAVDGAEPKERPKTPELEAVGELVGMAA